MKIINVGDFSLVYLNILLRRLQKGKITKQEFVKLQQTLSLWVENYDWEDDEDEW